MPLGVYRGLCEESQITQAVVDGDDDYPLLHEWSRVIIITAPNLQSAAVNPHHHSPTTALAVVDFRRRRIDIQEKAVLTPNPSRLRARATELICIEEKLRENPVGFWWFPAARSDRCSRVRDAKKFILAAHRRADHHSTFSQNNKIVAFAISK